MIVYQNIIQGNEKVQTSEKVISMTKNKLPLHPFARVLVFGGCKQTQYPLVSTETGPDAEQGVGLG